MICKALGILACVLSFSVKADINPIRWLTELRTLEADYAQNLTLPAESGLESLQSGQGHLVLSTQPLRLCMTEKDPVDLEIVYDGHALWQYDKALMQVTRYAKEDITDAPLLKLFESPQWARWKVKRVDACPKAQACFYLTSPEANPQFKGVQLVFDASQIREMHIIMPSGEQNRYTFTHAKYNNPVASHSFEFKPPKGVDIIRAEKG